MAYDIIEGSSLSISRMPPVRLGHYYHVKSDTMNRTVENAKEIKDL